jgi:hypothetical protein
VPIYRCIHRLVGDPSRADDLTQETFLRVHQRLAGLALYKKYTDKFEIDDVPEPERNAWPTSAANPNHAANETRGV